ncbi:hypothetical protein [Burkholderia ubonensis]|uniref:hypothetical protein n=1 Tax=Burkholderia ubonensis TaxID=101571 RepID=UPI000AA1F94C|nr:hypothetical protein [Burkholderia ubonensis]
MNAQVILARATGYNCAALFVNQIVVAEANSTAEIERLVVKASHQLSTALGVPLVECTVDVPDEMDGKWGWPDLYTMLPPVAEQLAKQPLVVYGWQEGGVHPDTEQGPGDAWDELCFDANPPQAGTPYIIFAPVHQAYADGLDDVVRAKVLEDFTHWLNDRRQHDVSYVFHETVAKVESLISLSRVQPDADVLVEKVAMGVLGEQVDTAPGINWYCHREWRVNDVRKLVRGALEAAGVIKPAPKLESVGMGNNLEL